MNPMVPDEYPGIDFTDADIAKALGTTPAAGQTRQAGPAGSAPARTAPMAGPGRQAAPAGIAPEGTPKTTEEQIKEEMELQKRVLGEDPRIRKMQENLKKQSEEPFLDRMLRGLQMVAAGTQLKEEGKTEQLEKAMASEAARRAEIIKRQEKEAEVEGMDYERKSKIYQDVTGRRREEAKTKEDRAFQEKLVRLRADLTPKDFNNRILDMATGKTGSEKDQELAKRYLEGRTKSSALTYEDAAKIVDKRIADQFTLISDIQKREQAAGRPVPDADTIRRRLIEQEMAAGAGVAPRSNYDFSKADALVGSR
jgi:hypothetical protein